MSQSWYLQRRRLFGIIWRRIQRSFKPGAASGTSKWGVPNEIVDKQLRVDALRHRGVGLFIAWRVRGGSAVVSGCGWAGLGGDRWTRRRINVNLANNVIFDWGANSTHRNTGGDVYANIVHNYYVNGPSSSSTRFFSASGVGDTFVYQQGNYHDRDQDDTHDGFLVDTPSEIATAFVNFEPADSINSNGGGSPYDFYSWVEDAVISGENAYARVIGTGGAGASLWRDVIDQRVIDELETRSGTIINSQEVYRDEFGVLPGIDGLPTTIRPADWDTDGDGMPDMFENAYGLAKGDPADRNGIDLNSAGYTNLEVYLNSLVAVPEPATWILLMLETAAMLTVRRTAVSKPMR
jgi:hypothetical protein